MRGQNASIYARVPFQLPDELDDVSMTLRMRYSGGFVAYLNGREIARRNAPNPLAWNSKATATRSASETMKPEAFSLHLDDGLLRPGGNLLAIQGLNSDLNTVEFLISPVIETVSLGGLEYRYFLTPSPGGPNGEGIPGFAEQPFFSLPHGFYEAPFDLVLGTATPGGRVRYTLDGSEPTQDNGLYYHGPIRIETTTPVRAAVFHDELHRSPSMGQTYLFMEDVIQQSRPTGYPTTWGGGVSAWYQLDSRVVDHHRDTITDDLRTIPVVSITTDVDGLFGRENGIYTNTTNKGQDWERFSSVEMIFPDGRPGFQINCGLRIQGGYGRMPNNRKHSFRLLFKRMHGPNRLEFPLYERSTVERFNTLVFRGMYNYSWHSHEGGFGSSIGQAEYMRDEFSRRTMIDMGEPGAHGTFVHLYLNGLYWGMYNLHERPDDAFAAEHMGGSRSEWDIITGGTRGTNTTRVKAGDKDAWNAMISLAQRGGLDRPERYEEIQQFVDIDNLIHYMLAVYYAGNRDAPTVIGGGGTPWNFYSSRRRLPGAGFNFYIWDAEWSLEEPNRNVVEFHDGRDNPAFVFQRLRANPDFRMRVADLVRRHLFNGGILTPEASIARYQGLATMIDRAIIGESARWGSVRFSTPRMRDPHWVNERDRILNTYLPYRTEILLDQLKQSNLYPEIPAPDFNRHGGHVDAGFQLEMKAEGDAMESVPLIAIDDAWRYEQSGRALPASWRGRDYDDSGWPSGRALLYVESANLPAPKNTQLLLGQTTYYFRKNFEVVRDFDPAEAQLSMRTIIDDGAVFYLNGVEIYRLGMPSGAISHTTFASRLIGTADWEGPFDLPISALRPGENIIAVEVHQVNANSSDIVFGIELDLRVPTQSDEPGLPIYFTLNGEDPRLPGGALNPSAIRYTEPIFVNDSIPARARTFVGNEWSALNEAVFTVRQSPTEQIARLRSWLRVTELMYDPPEGDPYEFVELHNAHPSESLSLAGVAFTDGVQYSFPPEAIIPAGGYILVHGAKPGAEQNAFRSHYRLDGSATLFGPYSGRFSNSGESVALTLTTTGQTIIAFTYSDDRGWPPEADGSGHSLVPTEIAMPHQRDGSLDYPGNWRASAHIGGSPGARDPEPQKTLVINEFEAFSDESDWIEILNTADETINLSGLYLSESRKNPAKWRLPTGSLEPGERIVFTQEEHFSDAFGLGRKGEEILLSYLSGVSGVDRVIDSVRFAAQEQSLSKGRWPDGEGGWLLMPPTPGETNQAPAPRIVISELNYHPRPPLPGLSDEPFEYIELHNPTDEPLSLWNERGSYRIADGVDFEFPQGTAIEPGGRILLVSFNPDDASALSAFLNAHGVSRLESPAMGPFEKRLSNRGERVALEAPQRNAPAGEEINWVIIDEVIYHDGPPWPTEADGEGMSLHRLDPNRSGNDPSNWEARPPAPSQSGDPTAMETWMLH